MDPDTVRSHLPMNPKMFAVLAVVLEGPAHGYRLREEVERRSGGTVVVDPGSLYRMVARLVDDGLLEEVPPPGDEASADARRRYYGPTELGRAVGRAEAARLRALVRGVERSADATPG